MRITLIVTEVILTKSEQKLNFLAIVSIVLYLQLHVLVHAHTNAAYQNNYHIYKPILFSARASLLWITLSARAQRILVGKK